MALPKLSARQPITRPDRTPSTEFLLFMEKARTAQEATDAAQQELIDAQQALLEAQQEIIAGLAQAVADIEEAMHIAGSAVELAQAASTASNDAQSTADEALASGSTSGSSTDPAIDVLDEDWVHGPQVNLTGVVAGTLKITGSGPQRDDDVMVDAGTFFGEWRIVEIDGMTEETVFTGDFRAYVPKPGLTTPVVNESAAEVSAFSMARTTTGAISYRLDARRKSGSAEITSLCLYLFARRVT